jgi:hypothetical protein
VVKQYVLDQLEAGKADLSPHLEQDRWSGYRLGTLDVGDVEVVDEVGPLKYGGGTIENTPFRGFGPLVGRRFAWLTGKC